MIWVTSMTNNPFWGEEEDEGWYYIRARDVSIFKPEGKVLQFWLYGKSKTHIKEILKTKPEIRDIEWIKKETPDFL